MISPIIKTFQLENDPKIPHDERKEEPRVKGDITKSNKQANDFKNEEKRQQKKSS
jgi:hypothetical protein